MRMRRIGLLFAPVVAWMVMAAVRSGEPSLPKDVLEEYRKISGKVDFNRHVKPVLSDKCFTCHGPDKAKVKAGLRLDQSASAFAALPESPGRYAIIPSDIRRSEVVRRILSTDPEEVMPTPASHLTLTAREKAMIVRWIEQGAVYQPHWAFVKPVKTDPPVRDAFSGAEHPIDRFILARLKEEGISPSGQASPALLLRRLSLDLTGLPPTIAETDAFLADSSSSAYERQVDRLLASPHFGERMAADWLDIARFSDSHGYTVDRLRDMSPYRDWVISAFNRNMPYDRFIHEQLAGDLMPSPSRDMLIATAFNRNHPQNTEGGIVEEEFQTEYVMDRTNTFGEAFMAISLGCARCHDHKYDPVSQQNYFELYSFFNNVLEAGQISFNDDLPTPTLLLPTDAQEAVIASIKAGIEAQEKKLLAAERNAVTASGAWIDARAYQDLASQAIPLAGLKAHFLLDGDLQNRLDSSQRGEMKHDHGQRGDKPAFVAGPEGRALALDGDVYLDLDQVGVFRKSEPFSIGIKVWIPKGLQEGVVFHKSEAERLYNFKGFHVYIRDGRFEVSMAHTAPSNAIILSAEQAVPRERWTQLTLCYDGSSRAAGLVLYQDGSPIPMKVVKDKLYKDIIFHRAKEPGLQVGGWYRGLGFRGGRADDIIVYDRRLTDFEVLILADRASWASLAGKLPDMLSEKERNILSTYYVQAIDADALEQRRLLKVLRTGLSDSTRNIREIMVMEEMPEPRPTHILLRGQYNMPGQRVYANTPPAIFGYPSSLSKDRYGLARWLTHPDHPLTARVAVNRLWQQFFGVGLVKTSEDFGNQGELPSHPELLDWLAVTFRESGWDIKKMVRLIVMSATYRQDSHAPAGIREADPENRLLARGPSGRLTAEMLRDNALVASGLINKKTGGQSIRPYQPAGLWEINSATYKADSTDGLHRRSLYIISKRTVPNPTLASFDASDRSACLSRRQRTNTPLQALVTLNDPTYLEASKALGQRMSRVGTVPGGIRMGFRALTGRWPSEKEAEILTSLFDAQRSRFRADPRKTAGWLAAGMFRIDEQADASDVAAYAVVASTIMNADATLTKR